MKSLWGKESCQYGRFGRLVLVVLLAFMTVPVLPAISPDQKVEALEGTANYADMFRGANRFGFDSGVSVGSDGTVGAASTSNFVRVPSSSTISSSACFASKRSISLLNSWEIRLQGNLPTIRANSKYESIFCYTAIGLSSMADASSIDGLGMGAGQNWIKTRGTLETLVTSTYLKNGTTQHAIESKTFSHWFPSSAITVSYDFAANKLTYSDNNGSVSYTGVRDWFGSSAYIFLMGGLDWDLGANTSEMTPPQPMEVKLKFQSMSLPHLSPSITNIQLVNPETNQAYGKDDVVEKGTIVRVECTVKNTHAHAGSEQFPMHVKLANTAEYPTQGLTPFGDENHPLQVNGTTVATAPGDNTVTGANGVPITLVGGAETKITYYATIDQSGGRAVTLSQQLIEDSFQGSVFQKAELLAEKSLVSAPDDVDPDDPNAPVAGTDYHYARKPAPNENGWNNTSPVSVEFFGGDFDSLSITDSAGSIVGVLGDREVWKRTEDTNGYAVVYQADNSENGALSSSRSDTIKIDTWKPTLSYNEVLDTLVASDEPPKGSSQATSGIWKIQRVNNSGDAIVASGEGDGVFDLDDGAGEVRRTLSAPANGYYVAVDAAGNRSLLMQVSSTLPPSVSRPLESTGNPDDPGKPVNPPVGPPVGLDDKVPEPVVIPSPDGLLHAVIDETITEIIDPAAPPFGGLLDAAKAKAMMDYRYATSSSVGITATVDELLDALGNPITSLDTTSPGECLLRRVVTDDQGNTTTINLHYRVVRDSCPTVSPWVPKDPDDPTGPKEPGDPIQPSSPVTTDPDGAQHTEVSADITEAVTRGVMDYAGAEELLRRHFALSSVDGGSGPTVTVQSISTSGGGVISAIDLSRVADYKIVYLVKDATGNTTTVRLGYHLVASHVPGVIVTPDPGTDPNPQPGDDPLNPKPRPIDPAYPPEIAPDGTQHATIEDEMRVPVEAGKSLSMADVRSLVQRRYDFTPEGGGAVTEVSLSVADASGALVNSIDKSRPGSWLVTYKVADQNGNTITIHLRYLVVAEPPSVIPTDPSEIDPSLPTIIPDPGRPAPGKPLEPVSQTVDPETGLVHAVVEDSIIIPTAKEPVTPNQMAALIQSYYKALTNWGDGKITAGVVHLFDAAGNPVDAINRMLPGVWTAEQLFTDGAGNTTLMRLHVKVVNGNADGSMEAGDNGSNADGDGDSGASASSSKGTRFGTAITQLPRTGGPLGPCPLHVLFALMALVVSSYSLMRLRSGKDRAEEQRAQAGASASVGATVAVSASRDESSAPSRYTVLDGIVHGTILCCTIALGLLRFCPYDLLFALVVAAIEVFWVWLMLRRSRRELQSAETTR